MIRRRFSHKTILAYVFYIRKFLLFCDKEPKRFSRKDCREFLFGFMNREFLWTKRLKGDVSGSSLNVALNSLRFMMEEVLRKSMRLNIRYSKKPKSLPVCLTKDEIKGIIDAIENENHNLLVSLMYGAGLRVSEVVKLRLTDLLLEQDIGWVRRGKGNKDRPFIIPKCLKDKLGKTIIEIRGRGRFFLFPGRKHAHLSARTVQAIVKIAARKAKIAQNVHPHTFRHSFATHVLEAGYDVTVVQSLLGHNEARTTLEYLHVINPKLLTVKSPLDD